MYMGCAAGWFSGKIPLMNHLAQKWLPICRRQSSLGGLTMPESHSQ